MAAKGAESKSLVTKKILEIFPNAFLYNSDKEIRIPLTEQGETIEIKVVLSCAKTLVREAAVLDWSGNSSTTPAAELVPASNEIGPPQISEEDRRKVQELMAKLGL
nr:MAG TPA: hypothetical protein [Caudoviricetes sp.]